MYVLYRLIPGRDHIHSNSSWRTPQFQPSCTTHHPLVRNKSKPQFHFVPLIFMSEAVFVAVL